MTTDQAPCIIRNKTSTAHSRGKNPSPDQVAQGRIENTLADAIDRAQGPNGSQPVAGSQLARLDLLHDIPRHLLLAGHLSNGPGSGSYLLAHNPPVFVIILYLILYTILF